MMRFKGSTDHPRSAITDSKLKRVVTNATTCRATPVSVYLNGDGEPCAVTSSDVNDYIREATGGDFTAKNFRTWGASVIAFDQC
jgi:DNA topoisomerase-1